MPDDLGTLMRSATETLVLPAEAATDVIRRYRRKRRRALAAVSLIAAGAVAAAVTIPLATADSSGPGNINRLVPVAPTPSASVTPLASVSGIDVTYLPRGFAAVPDYTLNAMVKENGHSSISQYYQPSGRASGDAAPDISLAVQRGYTADLDAFARESKGRSESWTTARGKRALLQTYQAVAPANSVQYELTWVEAPRVTLTIFSSGDVSLADVQRVADGLVVHLAAPQPADPTTALAAIREVVTQVYTGGQSASSMLAGVENGGQLSAALAKLTRIDPELVRTVRVKAIKIDFVRPDQAVASLTLSYLQDGYPQTDEPEVTVNQIDGRWLVSESSYCAVFSVLIGGCPAP